MTTIDPDALKQFQFLVFSKLEGAMTAGMIHLGDHLGLYRALADADGALTSAELAARTGLDERWVREWAFNQAAARIVAVTGEPERFSLTPEAVAVLASPEHEAFGIGMFHDLPQTMAALERLPESFRTGLGYDYDSHGPESAVGMERSFEPWNRVHLLPTVLPTLDGVVAKLTAGAGPPTSGAAPAAPCCCSPRRSRTAASPATTSPSTPSTGPRARLAESGLDNASFHDPREQPLPTTTPSTSSRRSTASTT